MTINVTSYCDVLGYTRCLGKSEIHLTKPISMRAIEARRDTNGYELFVYRLLVFVDRHSVMSSTLISNSNEQVIDKSFIYAVTFRLANALKKIIFLSTSVLECHWHCFA